MTLPTLRAEYEAILELASRRPIYHFAGAEAVVAERSGAPGEALALMRALTSGVAAPDHSDMCVCIIHRTRKRLSDNVLGQCYSCRQAIEHRPDVPRWVKKLCAFCALRETRGDA
jgi:hypothetical protein